jgi:hypothetical protein
MDARETARHPAPPRRASTGELLKELGGEVGTLVRQEVQLAKAELAEKGRRFGVGAVLFGVAALAGLAALGAATAAAILAVSLVMAPVFAALVVAAGFGLVGGLAVLAGKRNIQHATPPVPEETIETVKEDVAWAKSRLRSVKR